MRGIARLTGLAALCAVLSACPRPVRPPPPGLPPAPAVDTRGAQLYDIDPRASEIHILVFRSGTLSRFGHNHVVSSHAIDGRAWIHPEFPRSGFEFWFAVRELVVDDPQARREGASGFEPDISLSDRDGTLRNMLCPAVLDAERHPQVKVRAVRLAGSLEAPRITARITIRDASRDLQVPAHIASEGGRLTALQRRPVGVQ